jgi:hypothetical protein
VTRNACASSLSGNEPASQPGQTIPPAAAENAPRCSRSPHDAHEAGGQQQLHPERERLGAHGGLRHRVEQRQLVREQVVGGPVGLARVEQPQDGVAGLGGALERRPPLAQGRVRVHGVGARDRAEVAAALAQDQPHARERLEPPAEPRLHPPDALRDRAHAAAVLAVEVQDPICLAIADRPQNDCFRLEWGTHVPRLSLSWRTTR